MKKYLPAVSRVLLGLIFLITGLNKLFWFAPVPPMSASMTSFMNSLKATGYFMPFLGMVEITAGTLFLINRLLPFALLLAAPVILNILMVHVFLEPRVLPLALALFAFELYLAWTHRQAFRSIFVIHNVEQN